MYELHIFCLLCSLVFVKGATICKVPNGGAGECRAIAKCPLLNDLDNKPIRTEAEERFLRQSMCGNPSSYIVKVCCPFDITSFIIKPVEYTVLKETTTTEQPMPLPKPSPKPAVLSRPESTTKKPDDEIDKIYQSNGDRGNEIKDNLVVVPSGACGIDSSSGNKIFGGEATNIDQYPWLVLLEYSGGLFLCGGSLITSRFILTAAHCISGLNGKPLFARLSEYNTTSYPTDHVETDGGGYDSITVTVIPVQNALSHPDHNFSKRIHDIGIVKLQTEAVFSDFIKTICLPTVDLSSQFNRKTNFTVAGWGLDESLESSDVKKHVMLPYVKESYCKDRFPNLPLTNVICAGGQEGKDSCNGDSGGPLMYESDQSFVVIGVLSFGYRECGLEGWPSVYVNVFKYMKWITDVTEGRIQM